MTSYFLGPYISSMCGYIRAADSYSASTAASLDKCSADFSVVVTQRDSVANEKNACIAVMASTE
jgi:hypothetical protein